MDYWVFTEEQLLAALDAFITRRHPELVRGNHAYDKAADEANAIKEFLFHSPEARAYKLIVEGKR